MQREDVERERVNETPESEHDAGNVLTPAAQRRARQMRIFPDSSRAREDAGLNALCDEREGGPFVAVKLDDL